MRILITNDDGIHAAGILPFARWAQKLGDVTVIAPKVEQSGKSHSIELHKPFEVEEVDLGHNITAYSVDSSPADCIRFALLGQKKQYDLVFSGINRGYNMGQDIVYSGTMGAACEAAYLGVNAIAVSTDPAFYEGAVAHLDTVWDYFCRNHLLEQHNLYNVNIPPEVGSIHITRQGGPYFCDDFPNIGGKLYRAQGKCVYTPGDDLTIDTHCIAHGHISISPISTDRTHLALFNSLQNCK